MCWDLLPCIGCNVLEWAALYVCYVPELVDNFGFLISFFFDTFVC